MLLLSAACRGYGQTGKAVNSAPVNDTLKTFKKLCDQIKDCRGDYTLAGVINIANPTNPALEIKNVVFLFSKHGDQFYYRLGTTETINGQGVYLYIDHQNKNIMMSAQKQVNYDQGPLKPINVDETLRSEHYALTSLIRGDNQTISLVNEHHISCKQYAITFDKNTLKIKRLFMRLTDVRDPSNRNTEEVVDVHISQWDRSAALGNYLTKDKVIRTIGGKTRVTESFKNYRLTKM